MPSLQRDCVRVNKASISYADNSFTGEAAFTITSSVISLPACKLFAPRLANSSKNVSRKYQSWRMTKMP